MSQHATALLDHLLDHAQALRSATLPAATVKAATTFITDSVGVGLAGSRHPRLAQVRQAALAWGAGSGAQEWISGTHWPAPSAALLNAWCIHNQEYDCVHERAVVHPLATILPALLAHAQRLQAGGRCVSGAELINALVLAVDVAATLGSAQAAPMRFFRPAMCGLLGAAMGLAHLHGCGWQQTADVMGIAYSQLAGTMQAHLEGSPMLAMQVGLASRAAVVALDLALAGFNGPHGVLDGPFGYFDLFDAPLAPRLAEVQGVFDELRAPGRHCINEVSHKTHPTGRAAQGALDGLATLVAQHGLERSAITAVHLAAPPLILRLVGRPAHAAMDVNHARLCLPYLAATWLLTGDVTLADFEPHALADPQRRARAQTISFGPNACTDTNALAPQTLSLTMCDGRQFSTTLPAVRGHPDRPLSAAAQRIKFNACCAHAGLPPAQADALHAACQALPGATTLTPWLALMQVPDPPP